MERDWRRRSTCTRHATHECFSGFNVTNVKETTQLFSCAATLRPHSVIGLLMMMMMIPVGLMMNLEKGSKKSPLSQESNYFDLELIENYFGLLICKKNL